MYKHIALVFLLGLAFGCGREADSELDSVASEEPRLRFAELTQADAREQPQSYLVAFRQILSDERLHFASFTTAVQAHNQALGANFGRFGHSDKIRYLASLNLSDLAHSFQAVLNWNNPALLQANLPVVSNIASLVEVNFADDAEARSTLKAWLASGRIWFAEPNGKSQLAGPLESKIIDGFKDNQQNTPWLDEVSFIPAIQQMAALSSIAEPLIAVMDSGVDVMHPNLRDAIYINDQGQNKLCKDDLYGCNTTVAKKEVLGDGGVFPTGTSGFNVSCYGNEQCEHGTHVAGIIAARDAVGYIGMCPYCKILVVKVVEIDKSAGKDAFAIKDSSIIAGLAYVSGFKVGGQPLVRVINASFGKFEKSRSVELFLKALKSYGRGTLTVAAAGNEDTMKRQYPAGFDAVLSVSNVLSDTEHPTKSVSSNFGVWVDIAAPGDGSCAGFGGGGILSSVPGAGNGCKVGTSMASPVVAGIAGLVLAKEPDLTADQLEQRLRDTAVPDYLYADATNNGYRPNIQGVGLVPLLGSGVVNASIALDPTQDRAPPVTSQNLERVRSGCGLISGSSKGNDGFAWLLLIAPLLLLGGRLKKLKV